MTEDGSRSPDELILEKLGSKRDVLEALAELDNELSEDAEQVLQILEEDQE